MSKQRIINTRFWNDTYVSDLDPSEKLVFIYFLTNQFTDICGIYEIPIKQIALDTGLDKEMIEKIVNRFTKDGKMVYKEGWVAIKNFVKYQNTNPNVEKGINRCFSEAPEFIAKAFESLSKPSQESPKPNLTKLNLSGSEQSSQTPTQEAINFFSNEELQEKAVSYLMSKNVPEASARLEIKKFVSYWTEPNGSGTKERWQLQKTFDIKRRLLTWVSNVKVFNKANKREVIL